ncbi:hypothetical protein [Paraburkholderia caffeinilytica]|uniref:hypothetical protein n=1 Tax=Paraburkholderia caffeinilytica TaxID=1761016 RepID=UPI003DA0183E
MTDQPVREGSSGQSGAANVASAANMMPPPGSSAPLARGKPAGTRLGFFEPIGSRGCVAGGGAGYLSPP